MELPVRQPRDSDKTLRPFDEPEGAPALATSQLEPGARSWRVIRDLAEDESVLEVIKNEGTIHFRDIDWTVISRSSE